MKPKKIPASRGYGKAGEIELLQEKLYKSYNTTGSLERSIKSWAISRLAEAYFDGKDTSEHRLAIAFWEKSGRRLKHV